MAQGTTVLQIAQQALASIGADYPTSIISTSVQQQMQIKSLLYDEARFLRNQKIFPQSKRTHSFVTEANRSQYPLPKDFFAALLRSQWDRTNHWEMIGPMSDQSWNYRVYGIVAFENRVSYKIFGPDSNIYTNGGQFYINPTPGTGGDTLGYDYVSKNLFQPPFWTPLEVIAPGQYRFASGNVYVCAIGGTTDASTPPSATTFTVVDGTVTWNYLGLPYETIITDQDLCVFDDDIVVAGLKWRYLRAKTQTSDVEFQEHQALVNSAKARWFGDVSISLGGYEKNFPRPNIRDGSWG